VTRQIRTFSLLAVACAAALIPALLPAAEGRGTARKTPPPPVTAPPSSSGQLAVPARERDGSPVLSSDLDALSRTAAGGPNPRPPGLAFGDDGAVQVYIDIARDGAGAGDVVGAAAALGARVERVSDDGTIVQAMVPVGALRALAALPGVRQVRPPDRPYRFAGSVTSAGDAILHADQLRSVYGVGGAGVKVGVLSDGAEGLAASIASGDLPASVDTTTCDVIVSAPAGQPADATSPGAGAEGTAMAEIVHDLAPDAQIMIGYFGLNTTTATSLDFNAAVNCLAQNNDVVVDDVGWFNVGPYDGTSTVSQNTSNALNNAANRIRGYYTAVGNGAGNHYQELYTDFDPVGSYNAHRFQATASTTDIFGIGSVDFDPVYVTAGGTIAIFLQWNDPWGGSANDYDLYLFRDSTGTIVASSTNVQSGSQSPTERIVYTNNTGVSQYFDIVINKHSGAARTLDMFVLGDCAPLLTATGPCLNYDTASSSVSNQSDAGGGVMALGAIDAADAGNDAIEFFSSRGPTNDGRMKPDATAIDGVAVTANGGFFTPFFGTSAAAPHAAAVAALVLSCRPVLKAGEPGDNPANDRTALRSALTSTAVDLGSLGADNTYGSGRLSAAAAANAAGCPPDGDADGVPDVSDNCPSTPNPTQANNDRELIVLPHPRFAFDDVTNPDGDTAGDACDSDDDNDGLTDAAEISGPPCPSASGPTNPLKADSDGDLTSDALECLFGTDPASAASVPPPAPPGDTDGDFLPDSVEAALGTNPNAADSDGDGIRDGIEARGWHTNPLVPNTDGDACSDAKEIASVNNDQIVNAADLGSVASAFGPKTLPAYVLDFDVTRDGVISAADLGTVAVQFGVC